MNYSDYDNIYTLNESRSEISELKKDIRQTIRECNGNDKFLKKLKNAFTKSMPSSDKMSKIRTLVPKLFDVCYTSNVVVQCAPYYDGYTYMYYEYYTMVFIGIKNNILVRIDQQLCGSGFPIPLIRAVEIDDYTNGFNKEDYKFLINFCSKYKIIGFDLPGIIFKKKIVIKSEYCASHNTDRVRDAFMNAYDEIKLRYSNKYYVSKISKLGCYMKISKI